MNKPFLHTLFVVCATLVALFTSVHSIAEDYTVPANTRIQTSGNPLSTYGDIYITNDNSQLYLDNQANLGTHDNYYIKGEGKPEGAGNLGAIRFQGTGIVSGNIILQGNATIRAYGGTGAFGSATEGANINVGDYTFTVGGTTGQDNNFTWGLATITGTGTLNLNCNDSSGTGDIDFNKATLSDFSGTTNITGVRMRVNTLDDLGSTTGVTVNVKNTGQLWVNEGTVGSADTVATTKINLIGDGWNEGTRYGALRLDGTLFATVGLDANARITSYNGGTLNGVLDTKGHTLNIYTPNKDITVNSTISSDGTITKTGNNTANIYGNNSAFTGNWEVSAGYLRSNNSTAVTEAAASDPRFGSGTITLQGGGLMAGAGQNYISNDIIAKADTTSTLNTPGNNLRLMGDISGSGNLRKTGNYSAMLSGDNSAFSGVYTAQESNTFLINNNSGSAQAQWVANANLVGADGGGSYELGSLSGSGALKAGYNAPIVTTYKIGALGLDTTFSGTMVNNNTGVLAVEKVGTGTMTLNNSGNTFTGGLTVSEGAIAVRGAGTYGTGKVTVKPAGKLILGRTAATTLNNTFDIKGDLEVESGTVTVDAAATEISLQNLIVRSDSTFNTNGKSIPVAKSFQQVGKAQYTFTDSGAAVTGSNVMENAQITLNGGTMSFKGFAVPSMTINDGLVVHLDASSADNFVFSEGTQQITTWKNLANSSNNANVAYISGTDNAVLTENGQNGLSVVTFPTSGNTAYNLQSSVQARTFFVVMKDGTTQTGYSNFFGETNGEYFFHRGNNGTLWYTTGDASPNLRNGTNLLNGEAASAGTNLGYDWNVLSTQATGNVRLDAISQDRAIANRGWDGDMAEILVYDTELSNDQVKEISQYLATKWNIGFDKGHYVDVTIGDFVSTNTIQVNENSTIDLGAFNSVTFGLTTVADGKTLTLNIPGAGDVIEWKSDITGGGSVVKSGAGELIISGAKDYSGDTEISTGTLDLTVPNAIASSDSVINNATIKFTGDQTLNNLSSDTTEGTRSVSGTGTLTLTNNTETQFVGDIDADSIRFAGDGKIKIKGTLTGSLETSDTPEIHLLGKLASGNLTISSGSMFSPGNSVGDFTVEAGNYTLESDATHLVEFVGGTLDWDQLFDTGAVSLQAGSFIEIALNGVTLDEQQTYELISSTGTMTNAATLSGLDGWELAVLDSGVDGYTHGLFLQKSFTPEPSVPEPSTWALMILSALGLFFLRKKSA